MFSFVNTRATMVTFRVANELSQVELNYRLLENIDQIDVVSKKKQPSSQLFIFNEYIYIYIF